MLSMTHKRKEPFQFRSITVRKVLRQTNASRLKVKFTTQGIACRPARQECHATLFRTSTARPAPEYGPIGLADWPFGGDKLYCCSFFIAYGPKKAYPE